MALSVEFRCGHMQRVDPDKTPSPICGECGDRQVARVIQARMPRFTGHVRGPMAETKALGPQAVQVAQQALVLKDT
jgi:hypothetical protein